ncbi:MAG: aminotransferase class V-fold PLP-dependent enzyme [Gemmatimonadetes bacterium]|nr:aminotransferase class V-fold PLP-dependent enzyme [Gemmatimonadota bacterium]
MSMDRRQLLGALGGIAAVRGLALTSDSENARNAPVATMPPPGVALPRKADFAIEEGTTFLNAAYTHPIPRVSVEAARRAAEWRGTMRPTMAPPPNPARSTPKALFAQLINAKPSEIAHVSSTSAGENLVVRALELEHRRDGNVVTDGLHFEGALMNLDVLRRRGLDVRVVPPTADARIDFRDLERAVDHKTRLIEISAAAMYNGFQHNLKAVADLAHAHGALVYVDIVHAAGAEPLDVKASGIDFAACSSFKWLMGDFGLGFLYAREEVWDKVTRPVVSYYQAASAEPNYPPHLPVGAYEPVTYEFSRNAAGLFEMGSLTGSAEVGVALLASSLVYVQALGPANIQAHRLPLIARLQQEMPRLGFAAVTPAGATSGIVTFARKGLLESDVPKRLADARINVRVAANWMRISPSVYNDMADIERLLEALS